MNGQVAFDFQQAFDALSVLVAGIVGWFLQMLHAKVDRIPEVYARRDDVKDRFDSVMSALGRIEDKLDGKADRH